MTDATDIPRQRLEAAASRHGIGVEAASVLLRALEAGHGGMAQFSHPELGGMGQWSPGMIMIGDMFNDDLKQRVAALCTELAALLREPGGAADPATAKGPAAAPRGAGQWWPAGLGAPAATGGQNDMQYAYFPDARRLAVRQQGRLGLYDTGAVRISGAAQQQGGTTSLRFATDQGPRELSDFRPVPPPDPTAQ